MLVWGQATGGGAGRGEGRGQAGGEQRIAEGSKPVFCELLRSQISKTRKTIEIYKKETYMNGRGFGVLFSFLLETHLGSSKEI